jgi:hypothetical protein
LKKTILFITIFFLSISSIIMANTYIDGYATSIDVGDLETHTGFGCGFIFDLRDNFAIITRGNYSFYTKDEIKPTKQKFTHISGGIGLEYGYPFPILTKYQIKWRSSLLLGSSMSEAGETEVDPTGTGVYLPVDGVKDFGFAICFYTGLRYDFTQHISPFLDLGYHYSFYENEMAKVSVAGYQIILGFRFALSSNRDLGSEY